MFSSVKMTSKWFELPQCILSKELQQLIEDLMLIIYDQLCLDGIETEKEWRKQLEQLPIVSCTVSNEDIGIIKVTFLSFEFPSLDTDRFVYELLDRFVLSKCQCTEIGSKSYSFEMTIKNMPRLYIADYLVQLGEQQSFEGFKVKVMTLKEQLRLAMLNKSFSFHLARSHQATLDRKVTKIHAELLSYMEEKEEEADAQFLLDIDRWLISFTQDFLEKRSSFLISKALHSLISIRKEIEWKGTVDPSKRHIQLSFFPSDLKFTFGTKPILGCVIGIGLTPLNEYFGEKHLSAALKAVLPSSGLTISPRHRLEESNVQMIYVEFEKEDGRYFSDKELEKLKIHLPAEIEARIQLFVPELFIIRNEEEIMKNILTLTQEIKSIEDIPQIMVRYEQHDEEVLVFCIILVRLLKGGESSIDEAFSQLNHSFILIPERTQIVSYLNGKDPIEANVFRIQLSDMTPFRRRNFSFDFFKARHYIAKMIEEAFGEIRDFNGGMILKQSENLNRFKEFLPERNADNPELIEKFFYSLNPIEIQATVGTETLKVFFETFFSILESEEAGYFSYRFQKNESQLFFFTKCNNHTFKATFEKQLEKEGVKDALILSSSILDHGFWYEGMVFNNMSVLHSKLENMLKNYLKHQVHPKILNLNLESKVSLDPRIGGDHLSAIINKTLFEGLMRLDKEGVPQLAIAERVHISEDKIRYIFTLRETFWSNGMKVLSEDFAYAWKKVLSPDFNTRFAYLFYPIKNARLAKEGRCSLDDIGVEVINDKTLEVILETPTPYFLEATTLGLYSPVNSYIDRIHPNWAQEKNDRFICNGPFCLRENRSFYTFELEKNPFFWNRQKITLDHILISQVSNKKASELFYSNKLDWLGPPLGLIKDDFKYLEEKVHYLPKPKSIWYLLNNQVFPFTNHKIREAFCLSIDRKKLMGPNVKYRLPAYSYLPLNHIKLFKDHQGLEEDPEKAYQIFQEGLKEIGIQEQDFPQVTIIHYNSETSNRCSSLIKEQWEETLGISCRIEQYEFSDLFEKLGKGEFQISCFCWFYWINDPIYTLNIYRHQNEKLNVFFWEDKEYQKLLNLADHELNNNKRLIYLDKAAEIFSKQHLILPIYYEYEPYLKQKNLKVPIVNDLGLVDYAYSSFSAS